MPPSRRERLLQALRAIDQLPKAMNGLQAYKHISEAINDLEDSIWGSDNWLPPRTFKTGYRTVRMYPIYPESFFPVPQFPGVTVLVARREWLFISRFGAIELREKVSESSCAFHLGTVLYAKEDAYGDGVWHPKNAS